ncbi:Flp/Fap pilin component [Adhaeretor mobilis]|uniref:Flp/Fap pilin component n=1 Tax=Adhaeretor mobilis TaxID=1930276 RepID=A0A517MXP1_9BACT|nr:Flp/Fap pilin component [Adhaeretor mobilis]
MARRIFQLLSFTALASDERGASMVEYALLTSLIAVAAVSSEWTLGDNTARTFDLVAGAAGVNPADSVGLTR